jgi:hypothetical protein
MYETSNEVLRLRWMNILYELGQQAGSNTIMLIPASMPEAGWPPIGTYGLKEIPKGEAPGNAGKRAAAKTEE